MFLEIRKQFTYVSKHLNENTCHKPYRTCVKLEQNMSSSPTETFFITDFFYQRYFKYVDENSGEYVLRKTM